jgi:hypothetical protein
VAKVSEKTWSVKQPKDSKLKASKVFLNLCSYTPARFAVADVHRCMAMDVLSIIDHSFCRLPSISSHISFTGVLFFIEGSITFEIKVRRIAVVRLE